VASGYAHAAWLPIPRPEAASEDAMDDIPDLLDAMDRLQEFPEDTEDVNELREQNRTMRKALRRAIVVLFRSSQPHITHDTLAALREMNEAVRGLSRLSEPTN
jgi:hypothetical protein